MRISIKAFTPCNISTQLNISKGNIFINNLNGELHEASLNSGSIKYLDSRGKKIQIESQNGFIGLINTIASENIDVKLTKGSIQIAVPQTTRATLALQSTTSVNAYVLNNLNFEGKRTQTLVKGKLNGGGYSINAVASLGNVTFRWYDKK